MTHMPIPYRPPYTLNDFWGQLTQGSLWKRYCEQNPIEAAVLVEHAEKKMADQADFIPVNITNTFTGNAILMMILTLHPAA